MKRSHKKKFWDFHNANPQVYTTLVTMARTFRSRRPDQRIGIKTLWECIRWDYWLSVATDDEFKLSNSYTAFYARLIMVKNQELKGIFQLKQSEADEDPILNPPDPLLDPTIPTIDEMLG